jgi:DNA-binding SARP family transcriptional activator
LVLRLRTFGGLSIENATSIGAATANRRPVALLALLAVRGRRGLSRDNVIALFWPESDAEHGRNSLSWAISVLRRELGAEDVLLGTTELRVNPDVLACDVIEFEDRIAANDLEAATRLYAGPFLDGVFLRNTPEFERWVDQERARLQHVQGDALERLATQAAAGGDDMSAVRFRRERAALAPNDSRAALRLMESLAASGDRAGALVHYQVHRALLHDEMGLEPHGALAEFAAALRARNGRTVDAPG